MNTSHLAEGVPEGSGKSLGALLDGLAQIAAPDDCVIKDIGLDSRKVGKGGLFIAVPGVAQDGRDYIKKAVENGAAAVVCEPFSQPVLQNLGSAPLVAVPHLKRHIGTIAARFFDHPSARLRMVGITGTNGKTTCAYLLAQMLELLGQRCALMGTLGNGFIGTLETSPLTTEDAVGTHRWLVKLLKEGATAVCMEVSSHGLEQRRVSGVAFDVALFTNRTRDHLDYHGDMQRYGRAKQRLFEFADLSCAVINVDDDFGRRLVERHTAPRCLRYGADGDVRSRNVKLHRKGMTFEVVFAEEGRDTAAVSQIISARLVGQVNVANLLGTIATLLALGYDLAEIAPHIGKLRPPPGRLETISSSSLLGKRHRFQPLVVVDYAHTPDALEHALRSLEPLFKSPAESAEEGIREGNLWVVFGCGGDRDQGKRPQMGRLAEDLADAVIVTDDNPRSEDPKDITAQILQGMKSYEGRHGGAARVIHDRRTAIETAIRHASADDIVLIAGKGHETTQVGKETVQFNDREVAAAVLTTLAQESHAQGERS